MEAQLFWHFSFMLTLVFVFFFPSKCSGMDRPIIRLDSTVFVALVGENLNIRGELTLPANQSRGKLTCYDPSHSPIYSCDVYETTDEPKIVQLELELKHLNCSGEYSCRYEKTTVYWFLRVSDGGYTDPVVWDYTEMIIVTVFTGVLLVFSVVGSVYVFRGHWKESITEHGDTGRKRKQNREEKKERQVEQDNMEAITAPSTSFYASLETRPRSIYDVLDRSAANRESEPSKAKPKKKEPPKMMVQPTQHQQEGVFESVYENF